MKIKKIFYLLIIFITSCTLNDQARLSVQCPCIVNRIIKNKDKEIITVVPISNKYKFFIFETTSLNNYFLGDTIK